MADNNQIRVPPHSENAEVSVLGALLLDKDAVIAVAEFLNPKTSMMTDTGKSLNAQFNYMKKEFRLMF